VVEGIFEDLRLAGIEPARSTPSSTARRSATNMVIERSGAEVGMITTRASATSCTWRRHKRPHNSRCSSTSLAVEAAVSGATAWW